MAITCNLVYFAGLMRYWIRAIASIDVRALSRGSCKLHVFLVYFTLDYSAWTLVAVTMERFVSVCFPLRARELCTRNHAKFILVIIFVILAAINSHYFWTYDGIINIKNDNSTSFSCGTAHNYHFYINIIWPWIDFCMASFLPFVTMIAANSAIIAKLMHAQYRRQHQMNITSSNNVKMTSMTAMLLVITFVFFCTTCPVVIYLIGYVYWEAQVDGAAYQLEVLDLWFYITINLAFVNNAVNFLLYCVSGPRFRKELMAMIHRSRVHPENTTNQSVTHEM